jgi:predicted transcriptional regulator
VSKPGGHYGAPVRRYAIALGCEVAHAAQLVYADGQDLARDDAFEPIGISCRICERTNCHQRSVPPLERRLTIAPHHRGTLPYEVN